MEFHYAKRDCRLLANGGVMLQRVCVEINVNRHFSLNFSKFCNKNNWPQCLILFSFVMLVLSAIQSLLKALANEDWLLPTQMFPRFPGTFAADRNKMFLILFRNILCRQQMFLSLRSLRNIMGNNVSSFTRALSDLLLFEFPLVRKRL